MAGIKTIKTEYAFQKQSGLNNDNKFLLYYEPQPLRDVVRKKKGKK